MPLPNSVNEPERFLGMIIYLGKFMPNLAEVVSPLCTLKKHVEFKLDKPQLDAIGKLILLLTTTSCLKYFNPNLQTHLKIDVSSEGLGALLEQNRRIPNDPKLYPVERASGLLQNNENSYPQIEKGTLSIVFGVERFHE